MVRNADDRTAGRRRRASPASLFPRPKTDMATRSPRRDFLKTAGAAASASAVWHAVGPSPASARQATADSPMQRITFAAIGVDGKGASDSKNAADEAQIVALCDVDDRKLTKSKARLSEFAPDAKTYADFREMLSEIGDDVDAVTVSTPDHTHAPAAVMAMGMGKHAYVQKPLTWSMQEARVLRELAAEKGVCTQMGNQGTSYDGLREGVEVIRSGALGDIKEVHVWTNRPVWAQGDGLPKTDDGKVKTDKVPPYLNWDLWLGPAPFREFTDGVYHPFEWRGWLDFGTGALGDMACHTANMVVMALDLFDADTAVAESSGIVDGQYPGNSKITFQFSERTNADGLKIPAMPLYWYDGGNKPPLELLMGQKMVNSGSLVVGTEGSLYSPNDYGGEYVLISQEEGKYDGYAPPERTLPRSPGHFQEFVEAIRKGDPSVALSNFDHGARLTETILLGNVALRAGQKVEWDADAMRVTNLSKEESSKLIGREYRDGWTLDPAEAVKVASS